MKTGADRDGKGTLPRWNLAQLYSAIDAPELLADQEKIDSLVGEFREAYADGVTYLSGAELGQAIAEYEEIEALRFKISSYMELLEADDHDNFAKTAPLKKWAADVMGDISFFSLEIGAMKESDLMTKLVAPELAQYAPWIARQRPEHSDALPGDLENLGYKYGEINADAWLRLYVETMSDLRIDHNGEAVTLEELRKRARAQDSPAEEKTAARQKMGAALKQKSPQLALVYNVIIRDMAIDAGLKKHHRPDQDVHLGNGLSQETVDSMFQAIKASFTQLSHKFYAWKAGQRGAEVMTAAQLSEDGADGGARTYSWEESRRLVLRSFKKFSPRFARIARKFFDENHIDAEPRQRKNPGGFCMPAGADRFPFILVNFNGKADDVSTLGHELGHGIHQALAEKARGMFLAETTTAVSETASIFAEMLVFEELFRSEKAPQLRRGLLAERIENMLGNALQQFSYYDFERRVHLEGKNGELSAERISAIWIETQKEYYGPSIAFDEYNRYSWMTVPHFFETPFYVHSYSFAQIAVSALFQEYKKALQQGPGIVAEFVENYTEMLETGITRNLYETFSPFGLDPELPEFWESGLALINKYLDELIQHDDKKPAPKTKAPAKKPPPPGL